MCTIPLAIAGLSIATTGYGIYQTNAAAKDAFAAQDRQARNAIEEQTTRTEEELGARMKEYRKTRARARVAGGESGAQGQSFAVGLNQLIQDADYDRALAAKNLSMGTRSTLADLDAARAQVRTVSGLEAGLQIAGSGVTAYRSAKELSTTTTKTIKKSGKN